MTTEAKEARKKNCKRCHKDKPFGEFPNSPHSKDGKLGFCNPCWSTKMEIASIGRAASGKKRKIQKARPVVAKANAALKAAGAVKEQFLVRAGDKTMTFAVEQKALRQAMEWQMKGRPVTVWRQCAFEMVLRIIG